MPANTSTGYPYPLGTDPVANGDDAIKALAEKVPMFQSGISTCPTLVVGTSSSWDVTFPVPFPVGSVPNVVATMQVSSMSGRQWAVQTVTNTKVTLLARSDASTTPFPVQWLAYLPGRP
jgi:hypothetical protein